MSEKTAVREGLRDLEQAGSSILEILVMLEVGGRQSLLIRLGRDGGIHRIGAGSPDRIETDRFIGKTGPEVLERLSARITPGFCHWLGQSRSHPAPRGELCELIIALKHADGRKPMMTWKYGSLSKWPPSEVLDFVDSAVELTTPWYEERKRELQLRTARGEYEWWQFFAIPPT
jgi:hypothetical protein